MIAAAKEIRRNYDGLKVKSEVLTGEAGKSDVAVAELDQYSTSGCMVAVADYSGASIKQYRCGIVRYSLPSSQTNFCPSDGPGCPTLTPNGEYAGALTLPFRPFSVHSSNAP